MFVNFFIQRPIFATSIALIMVLAGAAAIPVLPVAQFPTIAPPMVKVNTTYTGASARVVEATVTTPIEEQINGVEGMTYMSSDSSNDGSMGITVTFEVGYDLDIAAVDVQNRVDIAEPQLPNEVSRYGVTTSKQSTALTLAVHLVSPDGSRDGLFLSNYINIHIDDVIKRIPGVGNTTIWGERKYSMRIWLDPDKLASLGMTAADVADAVRDQNVQVAAGQIGQPPAPSGQQFQYTINTLGRLSEVSQFEDIILRTREDGSVVRIEDIGRVDLGAENYNTFSRLDNTTAIGIGIYQLPGANALGLALQVREKMAELSKNFPPGVEYRIVYDTTVFVRKSIEEVLITLIEAILLVFLVVFVFLQGFRATLIPAITIPVCLIGTFALMLAMGFSTNTLTLFGLVLATGLVVDDAIVVVENVSRLINQKGLSPREAARAAMSEVSGPIVATSLVLMAVFVPVALMPGISGQLYRQFALTIAGAVALSTVNAMTLSPALCAVFLRPEKQRRGWFFTKFNLGFQRFTDAYEGAVRVLCQKSMVVVVLFAALLVATYLLFRIVPTGFIPEEDQGYFIINVQGPPGSSLERTGKVMDEVIAILLSIPGVDHVVSIGGLNFLTSSNDPNAGACFPVLAPWSKRKTPDLQLGTIMARAQEKFAEIEGAIVVAFNAPPIQGLSPTGGFQFELQDRGSLGLETLARVADKMIEEGNERPELQDMFTTFRSNVPQLYLDLDRTKAKTLGIDINDVFDTLGIYLGALYVNQFNKFGRVYRVFMQAEEDFRDRTDDIERLYVRNEDGQMVPLSTLVTIRNEVGPQTITHYNLYRSAEINGAPAPGYSTGQAIRAMEELAAQVSPAGLEYEWTGAVYQQLKASALAPLIFALALIFVFLFLAALYESWTMPLIIMMAVPLALLGALVAQWMRGLTNDVYCQIGLVMLIGLASKSAILIVEFAKRRRAEGLGIVEAAMEAARIRLRPILMTAFAFILGVVPLVVASGAGANSRHSLGTAVFGGMIFSTILSLAVVPVFYVIIERLRERGLRDAGVEGAPGEPAAPETS